MQATITHSSGTTFSMIRVRIDKNSEHATPQERMWIATGFESERDEWRIIGTDTKGGTWVHLRFPTEWQCDAAMKELRAAIV